MTPPPPIPVARWSTDDVPRAQRFDYYASALSSALIPMQIEADGPEFFDANMTMTDLGGMAVVRQRGSAHRCFTTERDVGRSQERSYHLLVNTASSWQMAHRGRSRLAPGDAMFTDSQIPFSIETGSDYDFINIKFSEGWMRQWLPSPSALVGRPISAHDGWGRTLAAFVAEMSPRFLAGSPLPPSLLADQVGALLALTANGLAPERPKITPADKDLLSRIVDCLRQRCASPSLTAADIAAASGVPLRTFHRCFSRAGTTFARALIDARVDNALRMLESPLFRRVTIAEIARRAGFCDAAHFSRVVRSRLGINPGELRRRAGTTNTDEAVEKGRP